MPIPRSRTHEESRELLETWLATRRAGQVEITELRTPRIGYSAEILLFDATWRLGADTSTSEALVARIRPGHYSMFPDVDLHLHYRMLEVLWHEGIPVPRPLWYQPADGSPFGEPFFVMQRIDGLVPPEHPPYTSTGWVRELEPADQRAVFLGALDQLAALHRLDHTRLDLSFLPAMAAGEPGMNTEIKLFEEYIDWLLDGRREPLFDDALDALRGRMPVTDRLCLTWGDPKLSNILYRGTEPIGLLDWELATVSPPENDVAFFLTYHDSITRAHGHPELPGFPSDEEAVAHYERASGHILGDLAWYRLWHLLRLAAMSLRLTDLLTASGRLTPDSPKAPHHVPHDLLRAALARA